MQLDLNGRTQSVLSLEHMGQLLDEVDQVPQFELWIRSSDGQAMLMLRNGESSWLMYLRHEGDSGSSSRARDDVPGTAEFTLANGQHDEYPLSWCIDLDQCYKAVAYFYVNDGARPEWIKWHED